MAELKPCPFCGGKADIKKHYNRYSEWWLVSCLKCGVSQTGNGNEFSFEAIEAWNKRVEIDPFKLVEIDHVRRAEDGK